MIHTELAKARTKLLLNNPFFGTLALYLELEETREIPTAGTDEIKLYYNPEFIESLRASNPKLIQSILVHELLHIILQHLHRRGGRDVELWNIACDFVVNDLVRRSDLPLPRGALLSKEFEGLTAEEVYDRLLSKGSACGLRILDDHSKWDLVSRKSGREWKLRIASSLEISKDRGNLPDYLERMVAELLSPVVDWREALAHFIQPTKTDYSLSPPDRRFLNDLYGEIYLPELNDDNLEDVVIAIDTSGSITERQLTRFSSELVSILWAFPSLRAHVVVCDATVHSFITLESVEDWPEIELKGGGGTDFRPVFTEIDKRGLDPSCVIFFTDGEGTFPSKEPEYPIMWVLVESPGSIKIPFGDLIIMKEV